MNSFEKSFLFIFYLRYICYIVYLFIEFVIQPGQGFYSVAYLLGWSWLLYVGAYIIFLMAKALKSQYTGQPFTSGKRIWLHFLISLGLDVIYAIIYFIILPATTSNFATGTFKA